MSFPTYAHYKDSGVEWLGEVPAHWEVIRLANLFQQMAEEGTDDLPILSVSIHSGVSDKEMNDEEMDRKVTRSDDLSKYKRVMPGDLVYNMMRAWQGGFGAVTIAGMVSPAYVVARPTRIFVTEFIEQQLRTPNAVEEMRRNSRGVTDFRLRLYWEEFKTLQVVLPPIDDQRRIMEELNGETFKIDALITEQRTLIDLLKEKRQAVISHAVTKGLDPLVPMKDSGVEWLGEVPAHWETKRIKHLVESFEQGWSPQCEGYPVESDTEWGVLKVGCVNGGKFRREENKVLPMDIEPIPSLGICAGDLLISRANTRELVGSAAVADQDYSNLLLCDKLYRIRLKQQDCDPQFLGMYLGTASARGRIELSATGASSSMVNIGQSAILEMQLSLPPYGEQLQITSFLREETIRLDALTDEAQTTIALLQERRSALISAAVTGKIDVRQHTTEAA